MLTTRRAGEALFVVKFTIISNNLVGAVRVKQGATTFHIIRSFHDLSCQHVSTTLTSPRRASECKYVTSYVRTSTISYNNPTSSKALTGLIVHTLV